ncbi:MAG: kinase [Novosphingobium sp.]
MSPEPDGKLLSAALGLIEERLKDRGGLIVIGLAGSQGSGKSTLAKALCAALLADGVRCEAVSLDDFYLSPAARGELARTVHPLLQTRGVPGTHDVALAMATITALRAGHSAALPRFDKAHDAPLDPAQWRVADAGLRVLILEGWCIGARPQPDDLLDQPVNALERDEDADGSWRRFVNTQLAGPYHALFNKIDALIFLAAPDFPVVRDWRLQQEREIAGQGPRVMDEAAIARFIQHYQRITQWMLEDLPDRADLVIRLGCGRQVLAFES